MVNLSPFVQPPQGNSAQTEAQQEQLLKAKYGGMLPKKKLVPKEKGWVWQRCRDCGYLARAWTGISSPLPTCCRYFDSADWQMNKQRGATAPELAPKLQPTNPPPRRASQLGENQ